MSHQRTIEVAGYKVEVVRFFDGSFYYPVGSIYAEFEVSSKGFRQLSHYLRKYRWIRSLLLSVATELPL